MTTTDPSAPLVVQGAAGLLATIPPTLGFHPRNSLVQVCLHGPRDRVGPMGRVDLDPPAGHPRGDYQVGVTGTLLTVARRHAERVVLVWYRDTIAHQPAVVAAMAQTLERAGIPVIDVVGVSGGRYRSRQHGTGPDPWLSGGTTGREHSDVQRLLAATVLRGRTVLSDRHDLRRSIDGPPSGALLDAATRTFDDRAQTAPPRLAAYRAVLDTALRECADRGDLTAERSAEVVQGLDDPTLCGHLVARAVGDHALPWVAMLSACARWTPDLHAGDLCALLALVAYCEGDGALAQVAVDRSLTCRTGHSMARLMLQVMAAGVEPAVVATHFRSAGLGA